MNAGLVYKGILLLVCVLLHVSRVKGTVQPFVTPGVPACYVSRSQYEYVEGLSKRCDHGSTSRTVCGGGVDKYFFCSKDHDCCYNLGCPACCTSRDWLTSNEVAGIVIVCVVFTVTVMITSYIIVGKFCKLRPSA